MNEITVYDSGGNSINTLTQWDENIYVYIPETYLLSDTGNKYIHFFNDSMNEAFVAEVSSENNSIKAKIPNILLTQEYPIIGFVYNENDTEGKSVCFFRISIKKRPQPASYVYTETETYVRAETLIDECKKYARIAQESAANLGECIINIPLNSSTDDFVSGEKLSDILSKIQNRINLLMDRFPSA